MNRLLQLLLLLLLLLISAATSAQVGVGTPAPNAKAALDIQASDKGLLIPRLTAAQRTAISSPPQGLMVYQTDGTASGGAQTGFWYYAGAPAQWVFLNPTPSGTGSLTLPYAGTINYEGPAFSITNTAFDGVAVSATTTNNDSPAVRGRNTDTSGSDGVGVQGSSQRGNGVAGSSFSGGVGVAGESVSGIGLRGTSITGVAVKGYKNGSDRGRVAEFTNESGSNDSTAVHVTSAGDRPTLRAVNTATSGQAAIRGVKQAAAADGIGVEGVITSGASGNAAGVLGDDKSGSGTGSGVLGLTARGYGVRGIASANGGYGVSGSATNSYGVIGNSQSGTGVYGQTAASAGGGAGVAGTNTNIGVGVRGTAAAGVGVLGETTGSGDGVVGRATTGSGVSGVSISGAGVYGSTSTGLAGVQGANSSSSGIGVLGTTANGTGVRGEATGSNGFGVTGVASSSNSYGVVGAATGAATGVVGQASGTGQAGYFNQNNSSSTANALEVQNSSLGRTAYFNRSNTSSTANALEVQNGGVGGTALFDQTNTANAAPGLHLRSTAAVGGRLLLTGVGGVTQTGAGRIDFNVNSNPLAQVVGYVDPSIAGPTLDFNVRRGFAGTLERCLSLSNSIGSQLFGGLSVYGNSNSGGNLYVQGNFSVSGAKAFKIDHPLDPENQYLYHACVESPDMKNIYDGTVALDAQGAATVRLPAYFEALNRDFRYQLTAVGAPGLGLYVAEEIRGNRFRIAGGTPGARVSWQVTGIRQDKSALKHPLVPEVAKEPTNRGKYLTPSAYGLPESRGIGYEQPAALAPANSPNRTAAPGQLGDTPAALFTSHDE